MKRLRSPVKWFGGKGNMVEKLLPLLPEHKIYVEPFGGGGSLLIAKDPSEIEVYNDVDEGLVTFFRVIRDPEKFGRFYHLAIHTPYSRSEWQACKEWQKYEDDVTRAWAFFVAIRQSHSGHGHSLSRVVTASRKNMAVTTSSWTSILEMLPAICQRLMRVQIEQKDFRDIIKEYDTEDTLFYCDPPYISETRRDGRYKHEMTAEDHQELVEILLKVKGKVVLSGYAHPIYEPLEQAGWSRNDFETCCYASGRTRETSNLPKEQLKRIESVWISPNNKEPRQQILI